MRLEPRLMHCARGDFKCLVLFRLLTAELINGELFVGDKIPYIPQRIVSYAVFAGGATLCLMLAAAAIS